MKKTSMKSTRERMTFRKHVVRGYAGILFHFVPTAHWWAEIGL